MSGCFNTRNFQRLNFWTIEIAREGGVVSSVQSRMINPSSLPTRGGWVGGGGGGKSNFLCPHTNCHEKCWGMGGLPEPPTRKRQTYMQRVRWVRTHPPPLPTDQKGPPGKNQRRTYEKRNAKDGSFLLICQRHVVVIR